MTITETVTFDDVKKQRKVEQQQLLDISFKHILKQGGPSMGGEEGTVCMYRGDNGAGCAAAPFITKYDPQMERKTIYSVEEFVKEHPERGALDSRVSPNITFVAQLQQAHDNSARSVRKEDGTWVSISGAEFMVSYLKSVINIAAEYGLQLPSTR